MSGEIEEMRSQIEDLVGKVSDLAMQDLRETIDLAKIRHLPKRSNFYALDDPWKRRIIFFQI